MKLRHNVTEADWQQTRQQYLTLPDDMGLHVLNLADKLTRLWEAELTVNPAATGRLRDIWRTNTDDVDADTALEAALLIFQYWADTDTLWNVILTQVERFALTLVVRQRQAEYEAQDNNR